MGEIKIKRKLSVKLNKVFNLKQKSDSNPSTPTSQKNQTSQNQQQRPSIIIGATYSHSDNEMIEKMHHKKKKKKRTKLKKENDANDQDQTFTFLKNIDMQSIISQSSQSINNLKDRFNQKVDKMKEKSNKNSDYLDNSDSIDWDARILTDIIRAGKLFVCGEINEIFEFPSFKNTQEKEELVRTTIRYLESAVQSVISDLLTNKDNKKNDAKMDKDAAKEIA